jgi:tripartite-type tricarboxylate transporter receptor subunit TctC
VPFSPGSGTDLTTRLIAVGMQDALKTTVVVENLPGASGQIAASAVAKAKADGYTLFFTTNTSQAANPSLFKSLPYDPIKDFAPITLLSETPFMLVVRKDMPVKNVKELAAWMKANPSEASYGFGNSTGQVAAAAVMKALDVKAVPVPYKGTPAAASDVIGGRLAFMFIDTAAAQAFIGPEGQLRAIAITSAARSPLAPGVPTLLEATGVEGLDLVAWLAVYAPAGTPTEIISKLNAVIHKTTSTQEYEARAKSLSSDLKPSTPEELGAYTKAAIESWRVKIKAAGIEPQ